MSDKRYFWLRLYDDFFDSLRVKKLRKLAGGDTFLIIYLKLQLVAMKNDGIIEWKGVEDNFTDELALELDEDPENVKMTLAYLLHAGLAETDDNLSFFFPYAVANTGSETASAQRVRECRARKALQCNTAVTDVKRECSAEKKIDIETNIEKEEETENKSFIHSSMHDEKLPTMVKMLRGYRERGWDERCCYQLAETYGISRRELDAEYERSGT